ncbi:hypothetical protein [Collinsella intestinalis]|uniref:hypothetical protein n=1 Tax=Collinsella intestinalis TaxID=147207 RepID=UPI0025A47A36|nr:hypothetical protein [Collinsella intestinalis]MDM8164212.1 hypothetical protein [Collinsella intestinalis]
MGYLPIIGAALGTVAALAVVAGAVYLLHDRLDRGRRPLVFVATFAVVATICFVQKMLFEADAGGGDPVSYFATAATAVLTSLGQAGAAFLGGNGFSLFPDAAGDAAGLAWIAANPGAFGLHALFELGNLLSLALTAEFALTLFTGFSTHLSLVQGHFDDVIIVRASASMAEHAQRFIEGAVAQAPGGGPVVISLVRDAEAGAKTWHIAAAGHVEAVDGDRALLEAACIARHLKKPRHAKSRTAPAHGAGTARKARRDGHSLYVLTFHDGRITVALYQPDSVRAWGPNDWADALGTADPGMDGETRAATGMDVPSDLYSYSIEEIKVRQLMRRLLPAHGPGVGLGLRPLTAMIIGDDIERMVLTIIHLVRNGQALFVDDAGAACPRVPRIAVASAAADRIERRLRRAYPALFPAATATEISGATTGGAADVDGPAPLTLPATLTFFTSKLDMIEQTPLDPAGITLVVNTESDAGRAPSQREVWHRVLKRRCPTIDPLYIQYDASEQPAFIWENGYGGRERSRAEELKRVLIYGSTADCMQANLVLHRSIDRRAMMVNLRYADTDARPDLFDDERNESYLDRAVAAWNDPSLTLYDRESSRATADFISAERLFWEEQANALRARSGRAELTAQDRAHLCDLVGRLEHLRWCAYMVTSGYIARPWDDLAEAFADSYRTYRQQGGDPTDRGSVRALVKNVLRDRHLKRHVALVDWESLPEVDAAIARIADTPENERALAQADVLGWVRSRCNQQTDRAIADQFIDPV